MIELTIATVDGGEIPPVPDAPSVLVIVVRVAELHAAGAGSLADRLLDAAALGWRAVVIDLATIRHLDVQAFDRSAARWIWRFYDRAAVRLVPPATLHGAALLGAAGIPAELLAPSRSAAVRAVAAA